MPMRGVAKVIVGLAAIPAFALAQAPRGADTLSQRAIADSQAVLRELDAAVRTSPRDAAAWFRRGMVAWTLAERSGAKPPVGGLDGTRIRRLADTSLRIAVELDPKNATYQLTMGAFLRLAPDPTARLAAVAFFDAALELARGMADPSLRSRAALEAGRARWLRYETRANQLLGCQTLAPSIDSASMNTAMDAQFFTGAALKILHNQLADCLKPSSPAEVDDYGRAEALFREAVVAAPADARAFRQLAMLLAEKDRWTELAAAARDRTFRQPADGWAWLTLGLALHRSGRSDAANALFDTAAARLGDSERARLFAFTRVLTPRDSAAYAAASAEKRADREQSFWAMADPLWSHRGNDPRTEFLARVAFAELRWTVDELNVRGADSDRGEIYIRYGPPTVIVAVRGCHWWDRCDLGGVELGGAIPPAPATDVKFLRSAILPGRSDVVTFWDYDNGLTVVFWGAPTYGTARLPHPDAHHIGTAIELQPAAFDNIASERILQIPLSVTRFRAPSDSVDLLILAQVPMTALRDAVPNAPVRADTWLLGRNDAGDFHDSTALNAAGLERAIYRVTQSEYLYRVEAVAPGAMVAGRTMRWITAGRDTLTGFATRGFGLSDLLLATFARPNKPVPARWSDFNIAPLLGALPSKSTLDIIWENYDVAARGGQSQYSIAITLQRQRSTGGRIAAAILGVAASAVGIDRRSDRVTMKFDRSGPAAPGAFVDRVSIAMGDTPAGDYRLTLEVTDRVSGRKASSASNITIRE